MSAPLRRRLSSGIIGKHCTIVLAFALVDMALTINIYRFVQQAALLFWSMAAVAQLSFAQPLSLAFQHLGRNDGLSQGSCPFVSRDSKGFVWIATEDGLNRFDGQRVKVYRPNSSSSHSMVGNIVTSVCFEDPATGDLWFTTYNAIHRYVYAYNHFDTFQVNNQAGQRLVADYYAFHLDTEGRLWLRTGTGNAGYLHCFDTRTGQDQILCPINGTHSTAILDSKGGVSQVLCTGIPSNGLEIIDLKHNFNRHDFFKTGKNACTAREVFVENDTLVWVGLSIGLAAFNPQTGDVRIDSTFEGRRIGSVWSVAPYSRHLLFVATQKEGLWLFDRNLRRFVQRFTHTPDNPFSLLDNEVENLFIDRQENLWIAHWRYGLSYVNLRKNKFFIPPSSKGNWYWQFLKGPDGNIWCSEPDKGLFIYAPDGRLLDTLKVFCPETQKKIRFRNALVFPEGSSVGLYANHLLRWDALRRELICVRNVPKMKDACRAPDGSILLLVSDKVFRWVHKSGENVLFEPVPFQKSYNLHDITRIYCDSRGRIYLSENFERLHVFEEKAGVLSLIKTIEGTGECKYFFERSKDHGLWVASSAGLLNITQQLDYRILNEVTDGLPSATYYAVQPDRQGYLWLSSNQGLLRYDIARHTVNRYLQLDGLFGPEFNNGAFYQADDGKIWAGGGGGLVVFHPDSIKNVPFEPQIQFVQILVNDQPRENGQSAETTMLLDLPFSQNTVSFEFVALEFSDPKANQFQYRLVGYENDWVNSGTRGFARYANLPPGHYTFEVLAANADGVWTKLPKTLKINIQTPFYKTWWFYLLCVIVISSLVYGWIWYRLQQALKIERIRVQISSDLHDDVGTLLAGLAMQSESLELTAADKDKNKLRRISEISRNAMAHMRDTVWAIDARKDKVENLLDRMREHAEETLTPRDIRFDIQTDNLSLKQNLSTTVRHNLYLIFKEAITNAAKHSNGDRVEVSLKKTDTGFEMRICDNGHAAEKNYKTTGLGTSNMRMRAEKIGATLDISRKEGFCITLRMGRLT